MSKHRVKENFIRFMLLWPVICFFWFYSPVFGAIPAHERAALIALYNSTNGDHWFNKTGWKTPPLAADGFAMPGTEKTWHGVACNSSNTSVQEINFFWNNLAGVLPPQLGNLRNLRKLSLWGFSNLNGSIPPELGNLINLLYLDLFENNLSGSIPPELGNLQNLGYLDLSKNRLNGSIPPELGNLQNLVYIDLSKNNLSGSIPPELGNLLGLANLYLHGNCLSGDIPTTLQNLVHLYDNDEWDSPGYGLAICWNALHTNDQSLIDFIYSRSDNKWCDWVDTQTVPPTDISASPASAYSIELQWQPIAYQAGPGCYRVFYSTRAEGPFKYFGQTEDKHASSITVDVLRTEVTYYFKVQTRTYPIFYNPNTVDSDFSEVVSAAPSPQPVIPISGVVTCKGARLAGVTITLSNNGGTIMTDADGYYIAAVKQGWSGTITPGKKNYTFTPEFYRYSSLFSEQIGQDFEAVPQSTITNRLISNK